MINTINISDEQLDKEPKFTTRHTIPPLIQKQLHPVYSFSKMQPSHEPAYKNQYVLTSIISETECSIAATKYGEHYMSDKLNKKLLVHILILLGIKRIYLKVIMT